MTAENIQDLLLQNDTNLGHRKISVARFHTSGVIEKVNAAHQGGGGGRSWLQSLRTAEIKVSLTPTQAGLVRHHVARAEETIKGIIGDTIECTLGVPAPSSKARFIRELPQSLWPLWVAPFPQYAYNSPLTGCSNPLNRILFGLTGEGELCQYQKIHVSRRT